MNEQEKLIALKNKRFEKKKKSFRVKLFKYSGMARIYRDGDGISALFRWYHPFNILIIFLLLLISIFSDESFPSLLKECFVLPKFWKNKKIKWI